MSNAASTPEFRKIMQVLYDSGRYRTSGEVLHEAWREYKARHGKTGSTQQRRYAMRKTVMGMNPIDYFLKFHVGDLVRTSRGIGRIIDQDTTNKRGWLLLVLIGGEKDARWFKATRVKKIRINPRKKKPLHQCVDCLTIYKGWGACPKCGGYKKILARKNPRKKKPRRSCPICGGRMQGDVCLTCLKKNPAAWRGLKRCYVCGSKYGLSRDKEGRIVCSAHASESLRPKKNPRKFRHQKLSSSRGLHHIRTMTVGKHRVIIGCPVQTHKGRCPVSTVATSILHPKSERNPIAIYNPKGVTLPASDIELRYRRSAGQYKGKHFRHPFKSSVSLIGLPSGDVLIKSHGKRLWGAVN